MGTSPDVDGLAACGADEPSEIRRLPCTDKMADFVPDKSGARSAPRGSTAVEEAGDERIDAPPNPGLIKRRADEPTRSLELHRLR